MSKCLYLIGSLRNERIPILAEKIRKDNPDVEVFDEWYSAGPEADDYWKAHQKGKGLSYQEALEGHAARNVFSFDKRHLDRSSHAILVLPAGRSGHMEIMYAAYGVGARTAILLDGTDDRWDVMYQFIPTILHSDKEINTWLANSVETPDSVIPALPLLQEEKTTKRNLEWNSCQPLHSKPLPKSLPSGQKSTTSITGEAGLSTRGLLGRL